jgi:hypothetical protein
MDMSVKILTVGSTQGLIHYFIPEGHTLKNKCQNSPLPQQCSEEMSGK